MSRLQPRVKGVTTSSASSQSTSASNEAQAKPSVSSHRQPVRSAQNSPHSERVTSLLIRRVLCSHLGDKGRTTPAPIDELLPPLTSSNEVDFQLYAFIAIIIRESVHTWYAKITPDHVFVDEVVKLIAHCTRALEQRLRDVDFESLLFDELPDLLHAHILAYRTAHHPLHPPPHESSPRQIYHSLWPLPALSPCPVGGLGTSEQEENEAAYTQLLVQGVLAILLPTEDLESDCLTALVGQILSQMIIGNGIGGKASEPWLLWEGITKIVDVIQEQLPKSKARVRAARSRSDLASRPLDLPDGKKGQSKVAKSIQKTFWLVLQYAFFAFSAIQFLLITIVTSPSLPSRLNSYATITGSTDSSHGHPQPRAHANSEILTDGRTLPDAKRPIISMKIWSCVASLLDLDARMPWLSATISMLHWGALTGPGELGNTDGMIDKILSHAIQTHILSPTRLPSLLLTLRAALFPNNLPAPPRATPTPNEALLIRRRCAESLLSLLPVPLQDVYFGPGRERRVREVEDVLDVFGDSYCNKHLMYAVTETVVVRLFPELVELGVEALLEERLS